MPNEPYRYSENLEVLFVLITSSLPLWVCCCGKRQYTDENPSFLLNCYKIYADPTLLLLILTYVVGYILLTRFRPSETSPES